MLLLAPVAFGKFMQDRGVDLLCGRHRDPDPDPGAGTERGRTTPTLEQGTFAGDGAWPDHGDRDAIHQHLKHTVQKEKQFVSGLAFAG